MKTTSIALASALLCFAAGCGGKDGGSMSPRTSTSSASTPPRSTTTAGHADQDAVLSQEAYDAQATKQINAQNADAEFEKLKKEIEDGG